MVGVSDVRVGFLRSRRSYICDDFRHLCVSEGIRRFRAEGICFREQLGGKRRDYHFRLLFFGVPAPEKLG